MPEAYVRLKFRAADGGGGGGPPLPRRPHGLVCARRMAHAAHEPWPIAAPPAVSLEAFTRAIALDPGFGPAYEHMPALLLALGRPEEARRARGHLPGPRPDLSPQIRKPAWRRCCWTRVRPAEPRRSGCSTRPRSTPSGSVAFEQGLASWPDTAETAIRVLRRLGEPGRGAGGAAPWVLDSVMWPQYLAHALAFRGHLREAFAVNERLLRQPSASPWSWFLDPFLDLSLLGIVPDSLARATFDRSLEADAAWGDFFTPTSLEGTALVAVARRHGGPGTLRRPGGSHGAGTQHPARGPAGSAARRDERRVPRSGAGRFHGGDPEAERDPRHALPGGRLRRQLLPPEPDAGAAPGGSR